MLGKRIGDLVVVREGPRDKNGRKMWVCRCSCGKEKVVSYGGLYRGTPRSCGCKTGELISKAKTKHGFGGHGVARRTEYRTWSQILQRCNNENNPAYPHYGGRGIKVCKRWLKFTNFLADMGERPSAAHSVDRINNDGGYNPKNCRWATRKEQSRNTSHTRYIKYGSITKSLADWSEETGIKRQTITRRLDVLGWTPGEALGKVSRVA